MVRPCHYLGILCEDNLLASLWAVAPIKALCSERQEDWQAKFGTLGLRCIELTGDSQLDDYFELQNAQIVTTTPVRLLPSSSSLLCCLPVYVTLS